MDNSAAVNTMEVTSPEAEVSSTPATISVSTDNGIEVDNKVYIKQHTTYLPNDPPPPYTQTQPHDVSTIPDGHLNTTKETQVVTVASNAPTTNQIIRVTHTKPNNYIAYSIFVLLCCCLPIGIVAIINSSQVNSRFANRDYEGAVNSSLSAKRWCNIGIAIGLAIYATSIILQLI